MNTLLVMAKNYEQANELWRHELKEKYEHLGRAKIVSNRDYTLNGLNPVGMTILYAGQYWLNKNYDSSAIHWFRKLGATEIYVGDEQRKLRAMKQDGGQIGLKNQPLLVIEVNDINSVPKVMYQGKAIEGRIAITYSWETSGLGNNGAHELFIQHSNKDDHSIKTIGIERIKIK